MNALANDWTFNTKWGAFEIAQRGARYHVRFDGELLGSYVSPEEALKVLIGGRTAWPSNGLDPSTVGFPDKLSQWTPRPA